MPRYSSHDYLVLESKKVFAPRPVVHRTQAPSSHVYTRWQRRRHDQIKTHKLSFIIRPASSETHRRRPLKEKNTNLSWSVDLSDCLHMISATKSSSQSPSCHGTEALQKRVSFLTFIPSYPDRKSYVQESGLDAFTSSSKRPRQSSTSELKQKKPRQRPTPTTARDIRHLRAEMITLEDSLHELHQEWQDGLSSKALRPHAYESAKQKWRTTQAQAFNKELKRRLMQQQFFLAALQSLIPQSTLFEHISGIHVLDAIHNPLHLPADTSDTERITTLLNRSEIALRLALHLTDKFTRAHVDKVSGFVPYQSTNIAADEKYTYVKSIFVVKVPHTNLQQLFHAVIQHFEHLPGEMKRHFDIDYELQEIHTVSKFHKYVCTRYKSPTSFSSISCTDVSERLTDTHGVVVVDFVDSDERYPEASELCRVRREDSVMIYMSPITDPATQQTQILLRYMRVNRFNLLPGSDGLCDEVQCIESWNNGDLFMALVCEALRSV